VRANRHAQPFRHAQRRVRRSANGVRRVGDPLRHQRVADRRRHPSSQDAGAPHAIDLAPLAAVGERRQRRVVQEHGTPDRHAERLDDALRGVRRPEPAADDAVGAAPSRGRDVMNERQTGFTHLLHPLRLHIERLLHDAGGHNGRPGSPGVSCS
jgi:hypothetical protein